MNLTRSAYVAALATVALWTAKAIAIAVAGGLGKSPLESPLFLLGLLACVVATVLTGQPSSCTARSAGGSSVR